MHFCAKAENGQAASRRLYSLFLEGFDKLGILVVFNAGVPICRDDKAEDGQKNSFAKPSLTAI
jgi:hypothetical protein